MLNDVKAKYVGKNGEVTALLRGMKDIPPEKRSEFGKMVNDLKVEITSLFDVKEEADENANKRQNHHGNFHTPKSRGGHSGNDCGFICRVSCNVVCNHIDA